METFLTMLLWILILVLTILSGRKSYGNVKNPAKASWEDEGGHSVMWVDMRQNNRYILLNLLFYKIDALDVIRLRIPLWSIILKSNFYLNLILFIVGITFTTDFELIMLVLSLFTIYSALVCFTILQLIDYLIWKYICGCEQKYIDNLLSPKVIFIYLFVQLTAVFMFLIKL